MQQHCYQYHVTNQLHRFQTSNLYAVKREPSTSSMKYMNMTIMMMNGDDNHNHHFNTDADKEVSVHSMYTYYTACTENHDDAHKIKHKFKNKECIAVTVSAKKMMHNPTNNNYTDSDMTTIKTHLFTFQIKLNCRL